MLAPLFLTSSLKTLRNNCSVLRLWNFVLRNPSRFRHRKSNVLCLKYVAKDVTRKGTFQAEGKLFTKVRVSY